MILLLKFYKLEQLVIIFLLGGLASASQAAFIGIFATQLGSLLSVQEGFLSKAISEFSTEVVYSLLFLCLTTWQLCAYISSRYINKLAFKKSAELSSTLFYTFIQLSYGEIKHKTTSETIASCVIEPARLCGSFLLPALISVNTLANIIIFTFVLSITNFYITIICLFVLSVSLLCSSKTIIRKSQSIAKMIPDIQNKKSIFIEEFFRKLEGIKLHGEEHKEDVLYEALNKEWYFSNSRLYNLVTLNRTASECMIFLGALILLLTVETYDFEKFLIMATILLRTVPVALSFYQGVVSCIANADLAKESISQKFVKYSVKKNDTTKEGKWTVSCLSDKNIFATVHNARSIHTVNGTKSALSNFDIKVGEVTIIQGPSGSGKTTLINGILGLLPLASGKVVFNEYYFKDLFEFQTAVQYVPQFPAVYVKELSELLNNLDHRISQKTLNLIFSFCDLTILKRVDLLSAASNLSGGEIKRFSIIHAILSDHKIVVLDEPTSGLDADSCRLFWELISCFERKAFIIITHEDVSNYNYDNYIDVN